MLPANGVLYDDTHLQLALLSLQGPHLETWFTCRTLCHMYFDLVHVHIVFTHCLAQLQDTGAVNVYHLNIPYLLAINARKTHLATEQLTRWFQRCLCSKLRSWLECPSAKQCQTFATGGD